MRKRVYPNDKHSLAALIFQHAQSVGFMASETPAVTIQWSLQCQYSLDDYTILLEFAVGVAYCGLCSRMLVT